jgi:uncharacterized membrane protein
MKFLIQVIVVAVAHLLLTASTLKGAETEAANALHAGLNQVGPLGAFLQESAALLGRPGSIILSHFPQDTLWRWPVLMANSVLWGIVIVGAFRIVFGRSRNA